MFFNRAEWRVLHVLCFFWALAISPRQISSAATAADCLIFQTQIEYAEVYMSPTALPAPLDDGRKFELNVAKKFEAHATAIHCRTDVMFAILMQLQWIGAIIAAGFVSPFTGIDQEASRIDMLVAVFAGGALAGIATALSVLRPGKFFTRTAIGI